ncbi:MAG TPA: hypothetical protein DD456_09885 [Stenotrophomonas sp.]|nr:hypothetical protein [Stenotrophomonas sp.]
MFVAMTLDRDRRGLGRDGAMHALAQQVYLDFLGVLVCSLLLIVPTPGRVNHGVLLLAVGGMLVVRTVRGRREQRPRPLLQQRFGLSVMGQPFFLAPGVLLVLSRVPEAFVLAMCAALALLVAGSRSAWLLVATDEAGPQA